MKRSNQVVLTAIFLAAVSTVRGQEVTQPMQQPQTPNDSTQSQHNGHSANHDGHHRFRLFGRHHGNSSPSTNQTNNSNAPRTRGFGNTMYRPAATAHS